MKLQHAADQANQRGVSSSFTGSAWQQTIAVGDGPNPLHVARVTFEPGARTVWHAHPHGQILLCTTGVGRFQIEGGPLLALKPGDSVTIGAREKHWHGAAPDQLFVHTSIQAEDDAGEQAIWMEPVSDADYGRVPEAA